MTNTPMPKVAREGYSTVCPYLLVPNVEKQIEFLQRVFGAQVKGDFSNQSGGFITHGEVRIGDTVIMIGRVNSQYPARVSMNYVYVDNADEVYAKALQNGATSVMEPVDQPYNDRSGGFTDPYGNEWWVAHPIQ